MKSSATRLHQFAWISLALALVLAGCGSQPAATQSSTPKKAAKKPKAVAREAQEKPVTAEEKLRPKPPRADQPPARTLADLAAQAEAEKEKPVDPLRFALPAVDEAKCQAREIRKLTSERLILYTDVASSPAVDELPHVFDLALPQWLAYFGIDAKRAEKWQMVGVLAKDKERFAGTGLWPEDLPQFLNGYMRDRQFWLYEQPSDFYRRELLLHEGTHGSRKIFWYLGSWSKNTAAAQLQA